VRERERDSFNFYKNPSKFQETYSLQTVWIWTTIYIFLYVHEYLLLVCLMTQ
jgi:hypothetical protein